MDRNKISTALFLLGMILTAAWLYESFTVGVGFVSTFIAPVGIAALIGSRMLGRKKEPPPADPQEDSIANQHEG